MYTKKCEQCGKDFQARTVRKKLCEDCLHENHIRRLWRRREINRQERDIEVSPETGFTRRCEICDKVFTTIFPKRCLCDACVEFVKQDNTQRKKRSKPPESKPDAPKKSLAEWAREADECNMDYGNYRAQIAAGKTFEELKATASQRTGYSGNRSYRSQHGVNLR